MTLIFLIIVLIVLFLFNFVILRNKPPKVKILASIGLVVGAIVLFIAVVAFLFYNSTDPRERAAEEAARNKWLSIKNLTKNRHQAIISYTFKDVNTVKKTNDTLNVATGSYNSSQHMLPILTGDSINFPENFKLRINDSLGNTIALYNKEQFLKKTVIGDSTYKPKNKMALNFYLIEIGDDTSKKSIAISP